MLHPQVSGKSRTASAFAVATVALGCLHHSAGSYPLYDPAAPRRPSTEVARLVGPIASVDGRDVRDLGRSFELLPGCHIVVTQKQMLDFGQAESLDRALFLPVTFAFQMKPSHAYVIDPPERVGGSNGVPLIRAHAEAPNGLKATVDPAVSERVIEDCKAGSPG
jgi:hypothetical protein